MKLTRFPGKFANVKLIITHWLGLEICTVSSESYSRKILVIKTLEISCQLWFKLFLCFAFFCTRSFYKPICKEVEYLYYLITVPVVLFKTAGRATRLNFLYDWRLDVWPMSWRNLFHFQYQMASRFLDDDREAKISAR